MSEKTQKTDPVVQVRQAYRDGDIDTLLAFATRGETDVRRSAVRYLGKAGDPRAVRPLLRLLRSSDPLLANLTIKALCEIGDVAARDPVFELATTAPSPGVRITAISALGDLGDRRAIPLLVDLVIPDELPPWYSQPDVFPKASERRTRKWASRRLVEMHATEALPALAEASTTSDWRHKLRLRLLRRRLATQRGAM